MKRVTDIVVSALAFAILLPLLLVAAVAIWAESGRPIIFRQRRVGRGGGDFTILKFRTMVSEPPDGDASALVTVSGDGRVTRVGRFLRRYKIDELPQLLNVLKGDMSLIGPRPEVRRYVSLFAEQYEVLLTVRPGLTDPASLAFRAEEAILADQPEPERYYVETVLPAKIALSLQYVQNRSARVDLAVILKTLRAVLLG